MSFQIYVSLKVTENKLEERDMSSSTEIKFPCSFCEEACDSEPLLREHEDSVHKEEMFRCLACTPEVSLFPSYQQVSRWSGQRHSA